MITTGGFFCFLKLLGLPGQLEYEVSDAFSLLPKQNKLFEVLQILKQLSRLIQP
jgi:hypothetical protein